MLAQFVGLHQRKQLEEFVQSAKAARENHQGLGQVRKPQLAHEKVVELKVQFLTDVRIGRLLKGKADVQPNALSAGIIGPAIGSLHDAWPPSAADDKAAVIGGQRIAPHRNTPRQFPGGIVILA